MLLRTLFFTLAMLALLPLASLAQDRASATRREAQCETTMLA